ncbi:MAG: hypothetical protein CMJ84_00810 [Planctomycetes bacterium]|nr:hypothetical protein [Planctomycetota bacterium]
MVAVCIAVGLASGSGGATTPAEVEGVASVSALQAAAPASDWVVDEADNVCGLTDPRHLTRPGVMKYDTVLNATSEMREMARKGIDRDSPEGQVLYNKAVDRVRRAAAAIMKDRKLDSVWKAISNKDPKRRALEITDQVRRKLDVSA